MKHQYCYFNLIIDCLITLNLIGCGSDDEVAEPENNSPVVEVIVIPKEFSPGEVRE